MPLLTFSEVDNLRSSMNTERSRYIPTWQAQGALISPHYFRQSQDKNNGNRKDERIINNIARRALRTFVSGMSNGATPQASEWFKLTVSNVSKAGIPSAKKYFSQLEKIFNNHFQISNTYRVLPMAYKSLGVFSNSAFAMLPHARFGFYFYPFIVGSYGLARDMEGNVNTFFRDYTLSVRQTVEQFGELTSTGHIDWSNMDPWVKQAWEASRYVDNVFLTNVIIPNKKPKQQSLKASDKKYQSYNYVMASGSNLKNQYNTGFRSRGSGGSNLAAGGRDFISVKGYDYFPVIASGWEIAPEDDYGIDGPGEIALGDVLTLQELERSRLTGIDKLLRPAMVGPSSLRRHQSSILAGGITYVDESSESAKYRPAFEVDPKMSELIGAKGDYEEAIRSAFFEDIFLKLAGDRLTSHVSARAIEEVAGEKLTAIGPMLGQLDQDQSSKLIDNAQIILGAQSLLPQAPQELEGENLRPEYISPLAKAAKAFKAVSAEEYVSFISSASEALQDPTLLKMVDAGKLVRDYADWKGIDPTYVPDEQEFQQIVQQIAQKQQQDEHTARMETASKTTKNLSQSKVGEDTNLLQMLQEEG